MKTIQTLAKSKLLGSSIIKNLQPNFTTNDLLLQRKNQGIYVLDANPYPAVLVECGYINNNNDVKQLTDDTKKEQLARDILKGVVAFANADKNTSSISNDNKEAVAQSTSDTAKKPAPLYIVDGKEMSAEEVHKIDNAKIESVNVLKGIEATKQYGDKGKNGVVVIQLKSSLQLESKQSSPIIIDDNPSTQTDKLASPLIVLDGKIINGREFHSLSQDKIGKINVLKDKAAVAKYGEKGSNGVIEITSKKKGNNNEVPDHFMQPVIVKDNSDTVSGSAQ